MALARQPVSQPVSKLASERSPELARSLARSLVVMRRDAHGLTFYECAKLCNCTDTVALFPNAMQSRADALCCAGYTNRELTEGTNRKYQRGLRLAEASERWLDSL